MAGSSRSCTGTTRTWTQRPEPKFQMGKDHRKEDRKKIEKTNCLLNHLKSKPHRKAEKPKQSEIHERRPQHSERNMNSPTPTSEIGAVPVSEVAA